MRIGAWVHDFDTPDLDEHFAAVAAAGLRSVRGYSVDYSEKVAPAVKRHGLSLVAGLSVDSEALLADWRSQVKLDELERTINLDCPIEAICVGNELREGGDAWESKRFSARLSFALARVLDEYRAWLEDRGYPVATVSSAGDPAGRSARAEVEPAAISSAGDPADRSDGSEVEPAGVVSGGSGDRCVRLTYAMEGIVFDSDGRFKDHLWPLIDRLDIVSINLYPMTEAHWRDFGAFEVSASFLLERKTWRREISKYEAHLRSTMDVLAGCGKPVMLSEMGFPSGIGYRIDGTIDGNDRVWPVSDNDAFAERMHEYVELLSAVSRDYDDLLEAVYFYEWRDNHHHRKIWNIEKSPIHTCFGLCDHEGTPKLDISALVRSAETA